LLASLDGVRLRPPGLAELTDCPGRVDDLALWVYTGARIIVFQIGRIGIN
jgi:hypothetical protein